MAKVKRSWDILSEEVKLQSVQNLIQFFDVEMGEDLGFIAAEEVLDHFMQTVGMRMYNEGIKDSIAFLQNRFEDLSLDMESLEKKPLI